MATLKKRLHHFNGEGYDVIHYETEACLVKMSDGQDAETVINNKSDKSHTHQKLVRIEDTRADATTPGDYYDQFKFLGIKNAEAIGLNNDTTGLVWLFGLNGWSDATGGPAHEIAFTQNGIFWRKAINVSGSYPDTWGPWCSLISDHGVNPRTNYDSTNKLDTFNTFTRSGGYNIKEWDFNDLTKDGIYECGSDTAQKNTPYGDGGVHFFVMVFCHATSWVRQVAYDVRSTRIYTRVKTNDTWNSWCEIITNYCSDSLHLVNGNGLCNVGVWDDTTNGYINTWFDCGISATTFLRINPIISKTNTNEYYFRVYTVKDSALTYRGELMPATYTTTDPGAGSSMQSNSVIYVIE